MPREDVCVKAGAATRYQRTRSWGGWPVLRPRRTVTHRACLPSVLGQAQATAEFLLETKASGCARDTQRAGGRAGPS